MFLGSPTQGWQFAGSVVQSCLNPAVGTVRVRGTMSKIPGHSNRVPETSFSKKVPLSMYNIVKVIRIKLE